MKTSLPSHYLMTGLTVLIIMLITTTGLSANTEELRSEGEELSQRAGNIAEKMIGPFNSKSSIEPWVGGKGYELLQDFVASADRLSRKMVESKELSSAGERLLSLSTRLKKNVQTIPSLDGSKKAGGVLEETRDILQQIHALDFRNVKR